MDSRLKDLRRWANIGLSGLMKEHPLGEFVLLVDVQAALQASAPATDLGLVGETNIPWSSSAPASNRCGAHSAGRQCTLEAGHHSWGKYDHEFEKASAPAPKTYSAASQDDSNPNVGGRAASGVTSVDARRAIGGLVTARMVSTAMDKAWLIQAREYNREVIAKELNALLAKEPDERDGEVVGQCGARGHS